MITATHIEKTPELRPQFDKRGGLLPVVVQDDRTQQILMVGYVNDLALRHSLDKRLATFWSTSRNALWTKGETSGDYLRLTEVWIDCDQDALIFRVEKMGTGVCHTRDDSGQARPSCFYRRLDLDQQTLVFDQQP